MMNEGVLDEVVQEYGSWRKKIENDVSNPDFSIYFFLRYLSSLCVKRS